MKCYGDTVFVDNQTTELQVVDAYLRGSELGTGLGTVWLNGQSSLISRPARIYYDGVLETWGASPGISDVVSATEVNFVFTWDEIIDDGLITTTDYSDAFDDNGYYNISIDSYTTDDFTGDKFYPVVDENYVSITDEESPKVHAQVTILEVLENFLNANDQAFYSEQYPESVEELFEMFELLPGEQSSESLDDDYTTADLASETWNWTGMVYEDVLWSLFSDVDIIFRLFENMNFVETMTASAHVLEVIAEGVDLSDMLRLAFPYTVVENMTHDDQLTFLSQVIADLVDGISINHEGTAQTFYNVALANGMKIADLATIVDMIVEAINFLDTTDVFKLVQVSTPELFEFDDTPEQYMSVFVASEEELEVDDNTLLQLIASNAIDEDLNFLIGDRKLDIEYSSWVMNSENFAVSNYDFSFTHSATFGQDSLFADSTGLYILEGDSDDGVDIESSITTASMDLGTTNLKRVNKLYLGTNANKLVVVARVENKYSARYKMIHNDDFIGLRMIDLGKGLKGYLWQFRLQNMDNSEFDIDDIEILPMVLGRKR